MERLHGKVLHSTANDKCYQITSQGSKEVTSLQCQQEEADGAYFSIPTVWSNVDLSRELIDILQAFTCLPYAPKATSTKVNDLGYDIICAKRGEIESHQLPPCQDCLVKHAQIAEYQAAIYRRCLEQGQKVPSPV